MAVVGNPVQIGQLVKRYRIVEELGRGGFGVVFKAIDEDLKRPVAIKFMLSAEQRDPNRFFREAIASTRIEHPGVVRVMEVGKTDDGYPFIVMEFVKGRVLTAVLKEANERRGRFGKDGLSIAWQVAYVLSEMHERGIIHRDLKPPNIMLVPDAMLPGGQRVKILDFGIAKILPHALSDDPQGVLGPATAQGEHPGTPAFMAPEQWKSNGNKDGRIDVYALGCMLYLFFAGRLPFESNNPYALLLMHLSEQPAPLAQLAPDTPAEILRLVDRMLAKKTDERPGMAEVRDTLADLLGLKPIVRSQPLVHVAAEQEPLLPTLQPDSSYAGAIASTADPISQAPTGEGTKSAATPSDIYCSSSELIAKGPPSLSDHLTAYEDSGGTASTSGAESLRTGFLVAKAPVASGRVEAFQKRDKLLFIGTAVAVAALSAVVVRAVVTVLPGSRPLRGTPASVAPLSVAMDHAPGGAALASAAAALEAKELKPDETTPDGTAPDGPPTDCEPVAPTATCLHGALPGAAERAFLQALTDADLSLCEGAFMTVVGKPRVEVKKALGVQRFKKEHFLMALRGHLLGTGFSGEVTVRCTEK
jgi:serine/threonine protein kinase